MVVRNRMASLGGAWAALTQVQRDAWNLYGANTPMTNRVGATIYLSGFNHFCRTNSVALACGLTLIAAAPTTFSLGDPDAAFAATFTVATQKVNVAFTTASGWAKETGAAMVVSMGIPENPTKSFFNGPWRQLGFVLGNATTAPTSPHAFDTVYPFAVGQKIWIQYRILNSDGRLTNFFRSSPVVVS